MYMYVYMYVCIYVYIYINNIYIYICIYTYPSIYAYVYIFIKVLIFASFLNKSKKTTRNVSYLLSIIPFKVKYVYMYICAFNLCKNVIVCAWNERMHTFYIYAYVCVYKYAYMNK